MNKHEFVRKIGHNFKNAKIIFVFTRYRDILFEREDEIFTQNSENDQQILNKITQIEKDQVENEWNNLSKQNRQLYIDQEENTWQMIMNADEFESGAKTPLQTPKPNQKAIKTQPQKAKKIKRPYSIGYHELNTENSAVKYYRKTNKESGRCYIHDDMPDVDQEDNPNSQHGFLANEPAKDDIQTGRFRIESDEPEAVQEDLEDLEESCLAYEAWKKSNKCDSCQGIGHFARNCPNLCNYCKKCGHIEANCSDKQNQLFCYGCRKIGNHYVANCPDAKCLYCQQKGHFKNECPKLKNVKCYNCNQSGHHAKYCSKPKKR